MRVAQLSDTHFLEGGAAAEGLGAYDTSEAFAAVAERLSARDDIDLVVVTGDVADHGRAEQYRMAADAFAGLGRPVNVCPGNHDADLAFTVGMARPEIGTSRVVTVGDWAFLFADSNAGVMELDDDGLATDPPGATRLHRHGTLGPREAAWIRRAHDATDAEHVFVWLHHPPGPRVPLCHDDAYAAEWSALLADLPRVRGLAGGHTHVPDEYTFAGRPVFVCPSLKNNFSLEPATWLPPGYRTLDFAPDGTVTSELHLVDDERWPRQPYGRALRSLFLGELSHEELAQIVARRMARQGEASG